jgi:ABC-2 type transport system ATP-binding protein
MTQWMIEADGLSKYFDDFLAVTNVSLQVEKGQILVLLGPNGAGKTTTIRMLTSILRPSHGWARIAGYNVVEQSSQVRASVGVLTEHHGLYGRMNADEYLEFFGKLYNLDTTHVKNRITKLLDQFGLTFARKKRLGEYSKGMRQKLALVRALLHEPPVILLDEPTSAMDPESAFIVRDAIQTLRNHERTLIICTHNLKEAEELADQIAIIRAGKIIRQGSLESVRRELLGHSEFVITLAKPITEYEPKPMYGCEFLSVNETQVKFKTDNPESINPQVISQLQADGLMIRTLEESQQSLEDIYLRTVSQEFNE